MRLLLLIVFLLAESAFSQEAQTPRLDEGGGSARPIGTNRVPPISPDNTSQFLMDFGVNVEDHPSGQGRHAHQSPAMANVCKVSSSNGELLGAACGRILWDTIHGQPTTGATYHATVPPRVDLLGVDAWWEPSVHCVTWDKRRRALYKVSKGKTCMNIIDAENQLMEWRIGGAIHGLDTETHGVYEGWIPVTITDSDHQWIIDVPIRYERFQAETTCTLNAGGNVVIGLDYTPTGDGIDGMLEITASSTSRTELVVDGGWEAGTHPSSTGWVRFNTNSDTWSIDITKTQLKPGGRSRGSAEDWTWIVGYYDAAGQGFKIQTQKEISFTESANVWADSDGWRHLFLGGSIAVEDWKSLNRTSATITGSSTVTLGCF